MTDLSPTITTLAAERGRAETSCVDLEHAVDISAQAIRRALANGRMKATDVGYVFISHSSAQQHWAVSVFERGLGRFAADRTLVAGTEDLATASLHAAIAVALSTPAGRRRLAQADAETQQLASIIEQRLKPGSPAGAVALELCAGGLNTAIAFAARDD